MSDRPNHRFGLVLDCVDPERLAAFWADALDYINVGSAGAYVALDPRDGNGPKLLLQQVTDPKTVKNRMHLDINAVDVEAEADRLTRLGAQRTASGTCQEHGSTWIVMADPEGNEFCICDGGNPTDPNTEGDR
jgi:predicted enzyme related to lactoylglutathione lyase